MKRGQDAATLLRHRMAKASAKSQYDEAFEIHATAEQLAAFWGEPDEAGTHRTAVQLLLERGEQEVNAKPFVEGAW